MIINSDDILANANQRAEWNNTPLEHITLLDMDGNKVEITKEEIKKWKFIGLNNFDFLLEKLEKFCV